MGSPLVFLLSIPKQASEITMVFGYVCDFFQLVN